MKSDFDLSAWPPPSLFSRRHFLRLGARLAGALALLPWVPGAAWAAALEAVFKERTVADVLKGLGDDIQSSDQITIVTPEIAENGAVVPVTVKSALPSTTEIYLVVEKNPNPLAAAFIIPDQTEPSISARVKVAQSSNLIAVVKADGKLYSATRETKVTLGGCGG
ncbi:MAG: thiosulfate oxidation carrier protein SoxY [Panacagrimonas sp.]|nr:thiosulfate oxidation carrier protein SoxY [Panacagrimonas sp.]MCC2658677.1 thiosulfate oxidation carrier protein SoxY [Panacagrimonas sp.]